MWLFNKCVHLQSVHRKTSKQYCYRGEDAVSHFCKKVRNITYDLINIYKQPMIDLTEREINEYENAKYCHICKNCLVRLKNIEKYAVMIITQENLEVLLFQFSI